MKKISFWETIALVVMVYISPVFASSSNFWGILFYGYFFIFFLLIAMPWVTLFSEDMLISLYAGALIWGMPVLFSSPETCFVNSMFLAIGGVGITLKSLIYMVKLIVKKEYRCASA